MITILCFKDYTGTEILLENFDIPEVRVILKHPSYVTFSKGEKGVERRQYIKLLNESEYKSVDVEKGIVRAIGSGFLKTQKTTCLLSKNLN